jgi:rare lipoprotein A
MNPAIYTAAHRSLAFGTKVKVTNRNNGRSVVVRINDRGPFIRGRVLDLSRAAAQNIGMVLPSIAGNHAVGTCEQSAQSLRFPWQASWDSFARIVTSQGNRRSLNAFGRPPRRGDFGSG